MAYRMAQMSELQGHLLLRVTKRVALMHRVVYTPPLTNFSSDLDESLEQVRDAYLQSPPQWRI